MNSPTCLATFHTTHEVIKAEQVVKKRELDVRAVSVPRKYGSDRGSGLRFPAMLLDPIVDILNENNIEPSGVYDE